MFDDNQRARRLYRAAGFVEEGRLREAALKETGRPADLVIMSILAREYGSGTTTAVAERAAERRV